MRSFWTDAPDRKPVHTRAAGGATRDRWIAAIAALTAAASLRLAAAPDSPQGDPAAAPEIVFTDEDRARILQHSPLPPPPPDPTNRVADDPRAAILGRRLFFETRLSPGGLSCASCHVPAHGFTDGKVVSQGLGAGRRRTPSLWNVAYQRWFFWDGRKDSLWSQALGPIESATEMGGDRAAAARLVASDPILRAGYEELFGPMPDLSDSSPSPGRVEAGASPIASGTTAAGGTAAAGASPGKGASQPRSGKPALPDTGARENDRDAVDRVFCGIGKAIAAYERRLVSGASPFDRFAADLREGRRSEALSDSARRGLKLFIGRGNCRVCHSGPNFSDGEFHDLGLPRGDTRPIDPGRFAGIESLLSDPFNERSPCSDAPAGPAGEKLRLLRKTSDTWGLFKTPSLRNVALRGPFMHRGQFATLRDVLRFYSTREGAVPGGPNQERILVPLLLSPEETEDLLAFLDSLTDDAVDPSLFKAPPG